ncbi:MAG: DUF3387 domain-containing protein [Nitrospira sp. SB0677_bin_15]|nr:DUF3387 domain-containing protein [Nitrospira sp. SB0667_bin_9]MYD30852.1 DUF3387 domain-containing protein [Nitrospira sp. SB0661_bin_20]MYG39839.1 DUF3387 domain-containing protein [Nitrospira sp. SB0677_bin_15]MYH01013.1 DUF3387 domain-containing protein [Nitrospira sp. SB0675_bin_23]MYJ22795.1 DUF3387 domain-containing protein [Nitrospira sp. SB0673_bin_12]
MEDKLSFYDALETNNIPIVVLQDDIPVDITSELVDTVRKNATINWPLRENVQNIFPRPANVLCTSRSRIG